MLDKKLRNVKNKLIERLNRGELEERQYWRAVYQFLFEEGIVKGPFENSTKEVAIKIGTKLIPKLPANEYWGFEKRYIALKGKELSKETQEDLDKYFKLKNNTKNYLKSEIGSSVISKSKFEEKIKSYLMEQTNLRGIASEEKQKEIVIRIATSLEREFKVKEDSEMIGEYDVESLERALDKL